MRKVSSAILILLCYSFCGHSQTEPSHTLRPAKEVVAATKVKVFPNPATNVINILGLKNSFQAQISISDVLGNVFLSRQWEIRNNSLNIPVATLPKGMYMITVCSNEENVKTKFYKR